MPGRARHIIWKLVNPKLFPRNAAAGPHIHAAGPYTHTNPETKTTISRAVRAYGARIAALIGKRHRQGGKIQLEGNGQTINEREIEREIVQLKVARDTAKNIQNANRYEDRIDIYKICIELSRATGGKKPNVFQVAAALAFERDYGGITEERYHRVLRQMASIYTHAPTSERKNLPWAGEPRNLLPTFYTEEGPTNLPSSIWGLIEQGKGHMLYASEILSQLGLEHTRRNFDRVNTALQFLDTFGVVRKQFTTIGKKNHPEGVWSPASQHPIRREIKNIDLYAIEKIFQLSPENAFIAIPKILENSPYNHNNLRNAINLLAKKGMVEIKRETNRKGAPNAARFTEYGKQLTDAWNTTPIGKPIIHPEYAALRKKIRNGENGNKSKPRKQA